MYREMFRQIIVLASFVVTVAVNALATTLLLNGINTGEISDMFSNYFTPAGYVFAIWGVIYLVLLVFTIYHSLPGQRRNPRLQAISWLFVLSNLLNAAWIFAWHYLLFPLTWVLMVGILVTLLIVYVRLGTTAPSAVEHWAVHVPFSIYVAWISVATIANTTVLLQYVGFDGGPLPQPVWSAIMLGIGGVLAAYIVLKRRDAAYGAVFIWAFIGIMTKYAGTAIVAYSAGVLVAGLAVGIAATFFRKTPRLWIAPTH